MNRIDVNLTRDVGAPSPPRPASQPRKTAPERTEDHGRKSPMQRLAAAKQFGQESLARNEIARNIRAADRTMARIQDLIEKMKSQLGRIVKNYPPFPPGSEERIRILKSISAFRKEIAQMTIPPEYDLAARILGERVGAPAQGCGAALVDLPSVAGDASDAEVAGALTRLDEAARDIAERRSSLASDSMDLGASAASSRGPHAAPADDKEAELKSVEVGYHISMNPEGTLAGRQSGIAQLVG